VAGVCFSPFAADATASHGHRELGAAQSEHGPVTAGIFREMPPQY
jgi:hypothetical protein